MPVRLAKGRHNLWHIHVENPVVVGQCGTMAVQVALMALGCVRPNLDALTGKRLTVTGTAHSPCHHESATAYPLHDWYTRAIIVGSTAHGTCWLDGLGLRCCWQQ